MHYEYVTCEIRCDSRRSPDCFRHFYGPRGVSIEAVRGMAASDGWQICPFSSRDLLALRDVCPKCRETERRFLAVATMNVTPEERAMIVEALREHGKWLAELTAAVEDGRAMLALAERLEREASGDQKGDGHESA